MYGKFTRYPMEFWKKIQMNAGIVVWGFDPSDKSHTGIMGATGNGTSFNPNPTYEDFGSDIDNVPPNTMQLKRIKSYDPVLTGTFKTMDEVLAAQLCPGAAASGVITPATELTDAMFQDVTLVADYTEVNADNNSTGAVAGYMAVTIKNALNTTGYQWKTNKDGKGEFQFEFHGHYDLNDPDNPPSEIYVIEPTRPLKPLTVTSIAGETTGNTKIGVSGYTLKTGESYVYQTAASTTPSVTPSADLTGWTALTNGSEITPTSGHTKITVAVKDASGHAVAAGSATLTVAS